MRRALSAVCLLFVVGIAPACQRSTPEPIAWETNLDAGLSRAKAEHRPAIIDFTATWCASCQELEKRTYTDPDVRRAAQRFVAIKVDATDLNEAMQAQLKRFDVAGLPAVLFVDANGRVQDRPRVSGFVEPPRFTAMLAKVQ